MRLLVNKFCPGLVAVAAAAVSSIAVSTASATPTVYTSKSAFVSALSAGYYLNDFSALSPFNGAPIATVAGSGGTPAVSYSISATGGLFINNDSGLNAVGNWIQADDLNLSVVTGNVYAIGAEFYLNDINGTNLAGTIAVGFSDGASGTATSAPTGPYGFFGVIDPAGGLSSMTVTGSNTGFLNMANLYVAGIVPEPTSLALLAPAGLILSRRRSR